ncbi:MULTISPECIES: CsgG/HfaB family protein [unclassified Thioalkalivibrio]|uniref:CsgG/HfaB family protein n=1 Tax=unclassified Thioalkalivibrio TaxID=2621013 RepID=UPI0003613DD9|nr:MULTISPECIES: CsgG/HfaB family protein [unclassified Thioalkalivibrio]
MKQLSRIGVMLGAALILSGCASFAAQPGNLEGTEATLMPRAGTYFDLLELPRPAAPVDAAVYDFRDQTGQYRPAPASTFSTAVTQGGSAMLSAALAESGWFRPLEREGLQNLLTERRIIRANLERIGQEDSLDNLRAARIVFEGGIIAYDSNLRTGGAGLEYYGVGASGEFKSDQVTVNLRAVDVATGDVLLNVNASKTIYSQEIRAGVFRFIDFRRLLDAEIGYTRNEPVQLAVMSAIESAVLHLITQGVDKGLWNVDDPTDMEHPVFQAYRSHQVPIM